MGRIASLINEYRDQDDQSNHHEHAKTFVRMKRADTVEPNIFNKLQKINNAAQDIVPRQGSDRIANDMRDMRK